MSSPFYKTYFVHPFIGGPVAVPQRGPVLLNIDTVDAASGQRIPDGAVVASKICINNFKTNRKNKK